MSSIEYNENAYFDDVSSIDFINEINGIIENERKNKCDEFSALVSFDGENVE